MVAADSSSKALAPKRSRLRRAVYLLLGCIGVFMVGMVGALGALLVVGERSIQRVEVEGIGEAPEREQEEGEPTPVRYEEFEDVLHVLVVGSDRREGLPEDVRNQIGGDDTDGERPDTIMLARVDPAQDDVSLISFPRDLLVTRCDGSRGKINAAYHIGETSGIGAASCMVQTITELSGLHIDHYVEIDFAGFINIVDIVDGVTVYLEHPIDDWRARLDLEAGCHRLTGVEALGFVRHRASDNDYGRIARQQRFIKELTQEAASLGNVVNLPRMFQMVEAGASAVTTDQDLSLDMLRRLAFSLRGFDGDNLVGRTVPADYEIINDIWYEIPREDESRQLYDAFSAGNLRGQEPREEPVVPEDEPDEAVVDEDADEGEESDEAFAAAEPQLAVAEVPPVHVLNGSDVAGLATTVADELAGHGFRIGVINNTDTAPSPEALVRYPASLAEEAETLAAYLGGAELQEGGVAEIEVVLGAEADPARIGEPPEPEAQDGTAAEGGSEAEEDDEPQEDLPEPPDPVDAHEEYVGAQAPPAHCYR